MPYCNKCGSNVPEGAAFCQVCGARVFSAPGTGSAQLPLSPPAPRPELPPSAARPPFSFPSTLDLRPIAPPPDLPFHPQSDEVIFREIIPQPRLRWRLMLGGILSSLVFIVILVPFSISFLVSGVVSSARLGVVVFFLTIIVIIMLISVVYAQLAYRKFRYWITNHRTVGRRGVIGYSIDSIPLETISDVIVQRSIADRILGLSSIWVQPFGGGAVGGYGAASYRFGAMTGSNSFLGLKPADATNLQQLIFYLRDVRRRETGRLI
jgi:membrane protein YdbS with pleckstrin-like domain